MPRLTNRQIAWWEAQPEGQTCVDCGKTGSKATVQPQMDGKGALCVDCIFKWNAQARERRKAQLAAMDRCEVPGCSRRGTWRVGTAGVFMCGPHKSRARKVFDRKMGNVGGLALFLPCPATGWDETIAMAQASAEGE